MAVPPPFDEVSGYPQESLTIDGQFRATRQLICAWEDRYDLRNFLLATPAQVYPYNRLWSQRPGFEVRVRNVTIAPLGKQGEFDVGLAFYEKALLTVQYASPTTADPIPNPDPAQYGNPQAMISETFADSGGEVRLDADSFRRDTGAALAPNEAPIQFNTEGVYILTRYNQQEVPQFAHDWRGTINAEPLTLVLYPNVTYQALTLMYKGFVENFGTQGTGSLGVTIQYVFNYRPQNWRTVWNAQTEVWETVNKKDGSGYVSPAANDFLQFYAW